MKPQSLDALWREALWPDYRIPVDPASWKTFASGLCCPKCRAFPFLDNPGIVLKVGNLQQAACGGMATVGIGPEKGKATVVDPKVAVDRLPETERSAHTPVEGEASTSSSYDLGGSAPQHPALSARASVALDSSSESEAPARAASVGTVPTTSIPTRAVILTAPPSETLLSEGCIPNKLRFKNLRLVIESPESDPGLSDNGSTQQSTVEAQAKRADEVSGEKKKERGIPFVFKITKYFHVRLLDYQPGISVTLVPYGDAQQGPTLTWSTWERFKEAAIKTDDMVAQMPLPRRILTL